VKVQAAYLACAGLLLGFAHISPPSGRTSVWVALGAGAAVGLAVYALVGEIVWRWGALAGLAPLVGWPGALGVSTVGFAYRHTRNHALVAYLALGAAFGGAFLATGRIEAAIVAHAAYNALVVLVPR
jgi:membrane protease YdiL (CAAX protease family)